MQDLLEFSPKERQQAFEEATARSTTIKNPIIIEKDFGVCWTLDQIFSNENLSPHVIFKGGTSLSKCYNIIDRFSEDIDLTFSKEYMGIDDENDPASCNSRKQRDKRLEVSSGHVFFSHPNPKSKVIPQNEFLQLNNQEIYKLITNIIDDDEETPFCPAKFFVTPTNSCFS